MFKKGFSLTELMVVIAIVAIMAAVALPAYKTYLFRSKSADVNDTLNYYKNYWTQQYSVKGDNFPSGTTYDFPPNKNKIAHLELWPQGIFFYMYSNEDGNNSGLSPALIRYVPVLDNGGSISWICDNMVNIINDQQAAYAEARAMFPDCTETTDSSVPSGPNPPYTWTGTHWRAN